MGRKLVLIGGGGHCKSILDCVLASRNYEEIIIVDKKERIGESVLGIPIIGDDSILKRISTDEYDAFPAVGSIKDISVRKKIVEQLIHAGFHIPNIIADSADVSDFAKLGKGIFIGKQAVVNADAIIEDFCIINTAAVIEHDCVLQEYVHIAPRAVLCGAVMVKQGTHIGAGAVVRQQILVSEHTLVGAGSVVVKNVGPNRKAYGNPCRIKE